MTACAIYLARPRTGWRVQSHPSSRLSLQLDKPQFGTLWAALNANHRSTCLLVQKSLVCMTKNRSTTSRVNYQRRHATSQGDDHGANTTEGKSSYAPLAFQGLALIHTVLAASLIASPERFVAAAFAAVPSGALITSLFRILGSIYLVAAVCCRRLASAARSGRLSSDTYKRLGLGVMGTGVATLIVFALFSRSIYMSLPFKLLLLVTNGVSTLVPWIFFELSLPPRPTTANSTPSSFVYRCAFYSSLLLLPALVNTFHGPQDPSAVLTPVGILGRYAISLIAAGFLLVSSVYRVLQDAAQRDRLGASTFKALNWAVFVLTSTVLGHVLLGIYHGVLMITPNAYVGLSTKQLFTQKWGEIYILAYLIFIPVVMTVSLRNAVKAR